MSQPAVGPRTGPVLIARDLLDRLAEAALQQDDGRDDALREDTQTGAEPTFQRTLTGPNATLALGESLF